MVDYTHGDLELKLKLLYLHEMTLGVDLRAFLPGGILWRRLFFSVLYLLFWKKVLSSRSANRVIENYFREFTNIYLNDASYKENLNDDFTLAIIVLYTVFSR